VGRKVAESKNLVPGRGGGRGFIGIGHSPCSFENPGKTIPGRIRGIQTEVIGS